MPSLNAHKKFGAMVFNGLTGELRQILSQNKNEYILGLQGPDIFFFYPGKKGNHVFETGKSAHRNAFNAFYPIAWRVMDKAAEPGPYFAYFAGTICHFMLDVSCHPIVDRGIEATGLTHGKLEMELDRLILEKDCRNVISYPDYAHLPALKPVASAAAAFYKEVTPEEAFISIVSMKALYKALCVNQPMYREGFAGVMKKLGHENKVASLMMTRDKSRLAEDFVIEMYDKLVEIIPDTRNNISEFFEYLKNGKKSIPEIAELNFSGKYPE